MKQCLSLVQQAEDKYLSFTKSCFEQNLETKADESVVIQYLLFSRTFNLMQMSVLCLNENIKGSGQGFVHSQISKYLNYSIVMKLTLFP